MGTSQSKGKQARCKLCKDDLHTSMLQDVILRTFMEYASSSGNTFYNIHSIPNTQKNRTTIRNFNERILTDSTKNPFYVALTSTSKVRLYCGCSLIHTIGDNPFITEEQVKRISDKHNELKTFAITVKDTNKAKERPHVLFDLTLQSCFQLQS